MQKASKVILVFLCLLIEASNIQAQTSGDLNNKVINSMERRPTFTIYGDNYLISGTEIGDFPSRSNSDAKFQIGFKQLLTEFNGFYKSALFLTYRQLSFWDVYQKSFPFRDNNYNPSLVLRKILIKNDQALGSFWFALEHESNGLGGADSRAWNFISLRYNTKLGKDWYGAMKGWLPIGISKDNKDLLDYKSYFEGSLTYFPTNRLIFETELRRSFTNDWLGKIMLAANFRLTQNGNQFIYLQYYNGYAESLIDYQQHVHMIRVGIAFKDLSWLIYE